MNAQTAAREIELNWCDCNRDAKANRYAAILGLVQQAIDEAVKEERERYVKLAETAKALTTWYFEGAPPPINKHAHAQFLKLKESLTGGSP